MNYDYIEHFRTDWSSWMLSREYFPCPWKIPKKLWEKYNKTHDEFFELNEKIEEYFERGHNPKVDGPCETSKG